MHPFLSHLRGTLLWLALLPVATHAAVPASYQFSSLQDAVPASQFQTDYADQVASMATAVNNADTMIGFWLNGAGVFHTHAVKFGANPQMTVLDTENFVGLTGNNTTCVWIICQTYAFGIRVIPPATETDVATGVTAFVNTPTDGATIGGSLPYTLYPGNFVDENAAGVVATTQVDSLGQFGVLLHATGGVIIADVPWLVAINDLAEPMALGWAGDMTEGDCLVYGEGCPDEDDETCVDEHGHPHRGHGRGHEEHGNGNGYGHDKCVCGSAIPRAGARPLPRDGITIGIGGPDSIGIDIDLTPNRSVVLRLLADGSVVHYYFPQAIAGTDDLANAFPLAINNNRAILRGDVQIGDTVLEKRLLSCVFDPAALDANADGIIDCTGGLTVLGGADGSIRAGSVLGFTLNNAGLLVGNAGYNAAGTGTPFVVDVTATDPEPVLLANLAAGAGNWEINAATDMNDGGRITGYGYKDCSLAPAALFLTTSASAPASALRFGRGAFEFPARLAPRGILTVAPTITGATGATELRVHVKKPEDADWTLLADWRTTPPAWRAGTYLGDVCFRIEARDSAARSAVASTVVRYRVAAEDTTNEGGGGTSPVKLAPSNRFRISDLLGAPGGLMLLALAFAGLRRRRA